MSDFHPVSQTRHSTKRWARYKSYQFAANDSVAALVAAEMPKACMAFPTGFIKTEQGYNPVAVLGLGGEQNLFVTKDSRWIGGHIPAVYRSYPFRLLQSGDQQLLCIDEASGLVIDAESASLNAESPPKAANTNEKLEHFFNDQAEPSEALKPIVEFLTQVERNRQATAIALGSLDKAQLLVPWEILVKGDGGKELRLEGLYRIDELAFNGLSSQAFEELRQSSAVALAYCQMLSMQHLQLLGQLAQAHTRAQAHAQARPLGTASGEIDFSFLSGTDPIAFGTGSSS